MPATTSMKKGVELYKQLAQRDYSGSDADQYAQLVQTLFSHLRQDLFPLLESAHRDGKKLSIVETQNKKILVNNYSVDNIVLV